MLAVAMLGSVCAVVPLGHADESEPADEAGVFLPTDRLAERRLEFARRLIDDARWSDAATLLDQILEADRDSFFRPDARASTWQSVKAEAGRMVGGLPKEGRDAYTLQFRARAERMLAEAIASGNSQGIVGVARRWFHTPAGQRATLLAAIEAIDAEQPLAAAAWLDRLSAAEASWLEPTLSIMRAIAWHRAGDEAAAEAILDKARVGQVTTARIGGRDVSVSYPPGGGREWLAALAGVPRAAAATADEWRLHRGDPARNAIVAASRPLLVPRYRVPLTRHPEEARWLEMRRKQAADQELPLLPAGTPLAVGGTLLVHTPMGLLAVDFATGKRLWLQGGSAAAPVADTAGDDEEMVEGDAEAGGGRRRRLLAPVFDDATSGTLASDGTRVFVVESHPDALVGRDGGLPQLQIFGAGRATGGWTGGNSLAAYRIADKGQPLWRIPVPAAADAEQAAAAWVMGPPLAVGDRLFVLVEEAGEVRLDVLEAATGRTLWTQPLAELDDELRADNRDNHARRMLGLSPALAEGVLVCPTGAGAVIAVDLATRTLLWAYNYPLAGPGDMIIMQNGVRVPRPGRILGGRVIVNGRIVGQPLDGSAGHWADASAILSGGRVILTPAGSEEIHCLDLRTGKVEWTRPRNEGLYVAGVVGGRVVVVGRTGIDALSLDTGASVWSTPVAADGAAISGRALLDAHRLFVPLDTPEVVEIDVATGKVIGRSAGRGGAVPGNLVAYRGEVVSQGVDSLDVFHQTAPLETRIETALQDGTEGQDDAWALLWRGHLKLERGGTADGLRDLRAAMTVEPDRFPPDMLAAAMLFAMQRDFVAAGPLWRDVVGLAASPELTRQALRVAVDGLIAAGDSAQAWEACQHLLGLPAADVGSEPGAALVADALDPALMMAEPRWIQGRLAELRILGPDAVRTAIDAFATTAVDGLLASARQSAEDDRLANGLAAFIDRFGRHPQAVRARRALVDELARLAASAAADSDAARGLQMRRDLLLIDLLHAGSPADREHVAPLLAEVRGRLGVASADDADAAWPVGRVAVSRSNRSRSADEHRVRMTRVLPIPVEAGIDALFPGMRLGFDMQQAGLIISDGFGRSVGEPLVIEESRAWGGMGSFNAASADAAVVGRLAVIRSGGFVTAYDLALGAGAGPGKNRHRRLWTHAGQPGDFLQQHGFSRVVNRRFPRSGSVPLGMQTPEPTAGDGDGDTTPGTGSISNQGSPVRVTGVPVFAGRSVQLRDPVTGAILWERHRLPAGGLTFGDDDMLCVCPPDGRQAIVLSMADGRKVRTCNLPGRDRRLLTHGRFVVAIEPSDGQRSGAGRGTAAAVTLQAIDPVDMSRIPLGTYSGEARATPAGDGALAVLEPGGRLTIIDLAAMRVVFTTLLPDMPTGLEQVNVLSWRDRYLVVAGRRETEDEARQMEKVGMIAALPQGMSGTQPVTGSIWAVDRTSGDMLWPVPATIIRHCLHPHQPRELPVLLFARQIDIRPGEGQPRLSVLCLDKRTGHAVSIDDRISSQQHMLFGCELRGDPATHAIAITPVGGTATEVKLEFTGAPMAPQPPFQAGGRPLVAGDLGTELEYWWKRLITLPLPF